MRRQSPNRRPPSLKAPDEPSPYVLQPYRCEESCTIKQAAAFLHVSVAYARELVDRYCIGRRVLDGKWYASWVGLHILVARDQAALDAFHAGRRDDPVLRPYLALAGLTERPRMAAGGDFGPTALPG